MTTNPEIIANIPEKCRDCPVFNRFVILLALQTGWDEDSTELASEYLDRADVADPSIADSIRNMGARIGESAMSSAEHRLETEKALNTVVMRMGDSCPGSKRGASGNGRLETALNFITGERTCNNPEFAELKDDPIIGLQLRLGNWIDTSKS